MEYIKEPNGNKHLDLIYEGEVKEALANGFGR
jgi:hypothetical protein